MTRNADEAAQRTLERHAFLLGLSDALRPLADPAEIQATASRALGERLGVQRVLYADVVDEDVVQLGRGWARGLAPLTGRHALSEYGAEVVEVLRSGGTLVVDDVDADRRLSPSARDAFRAHGVAALVCASLPKEGRWTAALGVHNAAARAWTEDEVALVVEAAKRTWEGVERAKVEAALRDSEERYRFLVESAREYAIFMLDVDGRITSWNTGAARIIGYSEDEAVGMPGRAIFTEEDREAGAPEAELSTAAREGRASDERWHVRKDGSVFWASGVLEAMRGPSGELKGFTKVLRDNTRRRQTEAALARERQRLEERVEERTRQVRELAARLTRAEQRERARIAQVLHDSVQQHLHAVHAKQGNAVKVLEARGNVPDEVVGELQEARRWLLDAIRVTRSLAVDLNPPVLRREGLALALSWLATQMRTLHGLEVELNAKHDGSRLPWEARLVAYQMVRELLFNIVKHAGTTRAWITIRDEPSSVVVEVEDDGRGFDPPSADAADAPGSHGLGLASVRERLHYLQGEMQVDSRLGEGTCVRLRIRVPEDAED